MAVVVACPYHNAAWADETLRVQLAEKVAASWPRSGAVFGVYRSAEGVEEAVGLDFESKAWYLIRETRVVGADPEGRVYDGPPRRGGLTFHSSPHSGVDSFLDPFFPTVTLRALLTTPGTFVDGEQTGDGWRLSFSLPRGRRDFALSELSQAEIDRWGGPEKIFQRVQVNASPSLRILSTQQEKGPLVVFSDAPRSLPGFQVMEVCPEPFSNLRLVKLEVKNSTCTPQFTMDAVESLVVRRRIAERKRQPILPATHDGEQPHQIAGPDADAGLVNSGSLLVAGGALVGIGVFAWYRKRKTGALA